MVRQWTRKCKICSTRFSPPSIFNGTDRQKISSRQTCSAMCAAKLRLDSRRWTAEENALLMRLAGSAPKAKILRAFRRHALEEGIIPRNWVAIRKRASIVGVSLKLEIDYFCIPELARRLDVGKTRPRYWTKKMGLKFCFETKYRKYISRAELTRFASKHPERFSGIRYNNLIQVIDDLELCRAISLKYPKRIDFALRPVRRIACTEVKSNKKKVYPSTCAAKKDKNLYLSKTSIERSLKLKIETCGYFFEYLD